MKRVTISDLENIVARINRMTGSPTTPYAKEGEKWVAQIGCYHLDQAYGGVTLHRMHNLSGGVEDVLRVGHVSKRELQSLLFAFIEGLSRTEAK